MNKNIFIAAFVLGAIAITWVGVGFAGSHHLALLMTVGIAAVYGFGALELRQFRQATATLTGALAAIPEPLIHLGEWLERIHPSLRNSVRLRIEGERSGLSGPALTPYLVGLLVMLGMLGTFLGMIVTFNGAVFALEGTADLQAIRAALAAPIRGLGLAFGTSVAGVAASAMLGLMSAVSRRERMLAAQRLDSQIATTLRGFSLTHQRQETFKALQSQALALPQVVDQLQAMMAQMERMNQQLNERLVSNQESFHNEAKGVYTDLACSVDRSLKDSLTQVTQVAGASIQPVVEAVMSGIAREAMLMHQRMVDTTQTQLGVLREEEAQRGDAAVERLGALHTTLTGSLSSHLAALGTALEEPIQRLIETASEAPRAAAEVIGQLRKELSSSMARDNELLDERSRIMETLNTLLDAINHAAAEQRAVIDSLVASSALALDKAGSKFAEQVEGETAKLSDISAHITASSVEVSSLGEAFGFAVNSFNEGNEKLIANLQRIENAMDKSMARSDEQLAYYVAQAREVIDLSLMSQKGIVEELRQMPSRQVALAGTVTAEVD